MDGEASGVDPPWEWQGYPYGERKQGWEQPGRSVPLLHYGLRWVALLGRCHGGNGRSWSSEDCFSAWSGFFKKYLNHSQQLLRLQVTQQHSHRWNGYGSKP